MINYDNLVNYLKVNALGKSNPITSRVICNYFGCSSADLRKNVNLARNNGYGICSSVKGYYYATNKEDINETINQLRSRIAKIKEAISGLEEGACV